MTLVLPGGAGMRGDHAADRMQHATENLGVGLLPAVLMSFVLVGAELFNSVLDSI
jgi:hypothetical protein